MNKHSIPYLQFLGATNIVTGSKTAVIAGDSIDDRTLVDCGLFQGMREHRQRNWNRLPIDPASFGSILLTHAHLDHSGYIPRVVQDGFQGPIYCTSATADLLEILLLDSAHIQEEQARFANKHNFSKHHPALPLYSTEDAKRALELVRIIQPDQTKQVGPHLTAHWSEAGHILGSGSIEVNIRKDSGKSVSVLFSGDIGRYGAPILPDPDNQGSPDYVIMESTYGDRLHPVSDLPQTLAETVKNSIDRKGVLLIPAFAVGRTQLILYTLRQLQDENAIPKIPIYIDSPMAIKVTHLHDAHTESLDDETNYLKVIGDHPLIPHNLFICESVQASKSLNQVRNNAIIISASGMATGGRIVHHLFQRLSHPEHTLMFAGYQAMGTRGRTILEGKDSVKIHGKQVKIRCHVEQVNGFSAHADQDELLTWLHKFDRIPPHILLNHGEPKSTKAFSEKLNESLDSQVQIPEYQEIIPLEVK